MVITRDEWPCVTLCNMTSVNISLVKIPPKCKVIFPQGVSRLSLWWDMINKSQSLIHTITICTTPHFKISYCCCFRVTINCIHLMPTWQYLLTLRRVFKKLWEFTNNELKLRMVLIKQYRYLVEIKRNAQHMIPLIRIPRQDSDVT